MGNTIQIKRGVFADLPTLSAGEFGFSTDTKQVHIGDGAVNHEVLMHRMFDAGTFLYAASDNTPAVKTPAEVMAILSGSASADFAMNSKKITGVADPASAQDAATKAYVDAVPAGVSVFVDLTDTPANFSGAGSKAVRVNPGANALEFVTFASTYLESSPTNGETTKAPDSNWAFDHNAAATEVHGAGANTLLNSGSDIDGGAY